MREILKSKVMILFVVMVLGVTYTSSLRSERLEDENLKEYHENIMLNVK